MPERSRTYSTVPAAVRYGLISQTDFDEVQAAIDVNDLQRFAALAVPLCEDNVPLFATLFLKYDAMPHLWREWENIRKYMRILVRLPRGHGKTEAFTKAALIHRICYSVVPGSKHEDPRVLALFETRDRAKDRMLVVRQLFESGGPAGLIGAIFRGAPGMPWAGLTIPEIAAKFGEWNDKVISLPHPRGMPKSDPNVRTLAPGEATVGFHPKLIIADDLVGPKIGSSDALRNKLDKWFGEAIVPMFKPYTRFWAPHTVFHEEDLNKNLERTGNYYTMEMKALNRFPTREDFIEHRDERGVLVRIELTPSGEELVPLWGCPTHSEAECPLTEQHMVEVGFHRPVKDLIMQWLENPLRFALQYMHVIRRTDQASVKPWMLRFFTKDPDDPRIGQPAKWHRDWAEWVDQHKEAGLKKQVPTIVAFTSGGVIEERRGRIVATIEAAKHGWDLGFGKKRTNDRTVCCRCYRTTDKRFFNIFEKGKWRHDVVWRMVVTMATTDPICKPSEVILEVDTQGIYPVEVERLMREMGMHDRFKLTPLHRTQDKDIVFTNSQLPLTMANGYWYIDIDDEDAINEILSVTPEQTGHDDVLDSATNVYPSLRVTNKLNPGFFGKPIRGTY